MSSRFAVYSLILSLALVIRLTCLASEPFFGDLPLSVEAIKTGGMKIQFPGYVPFHWTIKTLAGGTGSLNAGAVTVSILCGMAAVFFIMRTAEVLGGLRAATQAGIVASTSLLLVYFSGVGSSYITDLLAAAGVLYHGMRVIIANAAGRQVLWAFGWMAFGTLMRPLSGMWLFPAVVWLAWRFGSRAERLRCAGVCLLLAATLVGISAPYFGSWNEVLSSTGTVHSVAASGLNRTQFISMMGRIGGYPAYFLNVWLVILLISLPAASRLFQEGGASRDRLVFSILLILPYSAVLLRHLPQAGYTCLLAPVFVTFPFIAGVSRFRDRLVTVLTAAFAIVSLLQIYVARPYPPQTMSDVVLNAYFLQYSRSGVEVSMFETAASLAVKSGLAQNYVPETRRQLILKGGR
ncbi:MAG TPA: glycosyltransferase family 39 protein [Chthoniobacterales bacterium]|jgi:hypothetical protein